MGAKESKQDNHNGLEYIFKEIDTTGDGFITAQCL
jgi:Ca2+-binding EF-hand superfamily protein